MKYALTLLLFIFTLSSQAAPCVTKLTSSGTTQKHFTGPNPEYAFQRTIILRGFISQDDYWNQESPLAIEVSHMPNYLWYGEEDDDHYRVMFHYSYSTCTFIYNITKDSITRHDCHSTW